MPLRTSDIPQVWGRLFWNRCSLSSNFAARLVADLPKLILADARLISISVDYFRAIPLHVSRDNGKMEDDRSSIRDGPFTSNAIPSRREILMSPLPRLAPAIALLALLLPGKPADAQAKRQHIVQLLKQEMELKFDGEVPIKALFEIMMKHLKGPDGRDVRIIVFSEAFLAEDELAADPVETMVKFPAYPKKMPVSTILRLALSQVPSRNATFLIREGQIEITTHNAARPETLLGYPVTAGFSETPLKNAIEELSELSGATILIDPRIGDKARAPVTAVFTNNITLEAAVRLLAEMADLQAEVRDNVLFITGQPKPASACERGSLMVRNPYDGKHVRNFAQTTAPARGSGSLGSVRRPVHAAFVPLGATDRLRGEGRRRPGAGSAAASGAQAGELRLRSERLLP